MFDIVSASQFKKWWSSAIAHERARQSARRPLAALFGQGSAVRSSRRKRINGVEKCRVRSARTEHSVRDARRGAGADGDGRIGAERRSQRRVPCDHGFAHKSSPTRRGHRGKVSVSNLVQSQCATLNVAKRLGSHHLSARTSSTGRSPCLASARSLLRISFESAHHGRPRNFDTERPLSYCYELQLAKTWKASPNLKTVADL